MKSIAKIWTNPILIDESATILAGHARLEAAKRLGRTEVPTLTLVGLAPPGGAAGCERASDRDRTPDDLFHQPARRQRAGSLTRCRLLGCFGRWRRDRPGGGAAGARGVRTMRHAR